METMPTLYHNTVFKTRLDNQQPRNSTASRQCTQTYRFGLEYLTITPPVAFMMGGIGGVCLHVRTVGSSVRLPARLGGGQRYVARVFHILHKHIPHSQALKDTTIILRGRSNETSISSMCALLCDTRSRPVYYTLVTSSYVFLGGGGSPCGALRDIAVQPQFSANESARKRERPKLNWLPRIHTYGRGIMRDV